MVPFFCYLFSCLFMFSFTGKTTKEDAKKADRKYLAR